MSEASTSATKEGGPGGGSARAATQDSSPSSALAPRTKALIGAAAFVLLLAYAFVWWLGIEDDEINRILRHASSCILLSTWAFRGPDTDYRALARLGFWFFLGVAVLESCMRYFGS